MKILALEHAIAGAAGPVPPAFLREEARKAWELSQGGVLRELYFRQDRPAAILVLECNGPSEAAAVLAILPLVCEGFIGFEVIPLVAYPGFARPFARNGDPAP